MDVFKQQGATEMKLYRYKKDGCLYNLYEQRRPYYNLIAVPYFPNQGILAKSKRSISMEDFEVVSER
jgi:hypothetical protein